jgi:hypothetical protein
MEKEEISKKEEELVEAGFFEKRIGQDNIYYWVPFLYRDALNMIQGTADLED